LKILETLTTTELSNWVQQAKAYQGRVGSHIPQLATAKASWFAVHISCLSGNTYQEGDINRVFPLMSTIKPFSLLYLLEHLGTEKVFQWVGMEPSEAGFNSIEQLVTDRGRPRNPMINSGAITLAEKLPGKDASDRTQKFCDWLNRLAGSKLKLDEETLASVRLGGSQINHTIAKYLAVAGYIKNNSLAIDTYEQICCLSGTVEDLARLGMLLADGSKFKPQHCQIVNALMFTCGMYQASAKLAVRIGLPMKSGVSGTLLAVVPNEGVIAIYSPPLDSAGNSVSAIALVEALSQGLELSVFT
jgi:glutaminase